MERIHILGLELFAYHGVRAAERAHGQAFGLDLILEADLSRACASDCLEDTVNYSQVIRAASDAFTQEACNLIERAAQRTAEAVLAEFTQVRAVTVRVHKPDAPVRRRVDDIILEIQRRRDAET